MINNNRHACQVNLCVSNPILHSRCRIFVLSLYLLNADREIHNMAATPSQVKKANQAK